MPEVLDELYLLNSRNIKFFKKNRKAHQTHYKEHIVRLTNSSFKNYHYLEEYPLKKPDKNLIKNDSFIDVLKKRESIREYSDEPMTYNELSTLLYYSGGVKQMEPTRKRFIPSGGNLNSVDLYFFNLNVSGIPLGFYYYDFFRNSIFKIEEGNFKQKVHDDILYQTEFAEANLLFVFVSSYKRLRTKYGIRALRITHIDCGCYSMNLHLVAESMDLGSCALGGLIEADIEKMLDIDGIDNFVLLAQTVGKKQK